METGDFSSKPSFKHSLKFVDFSRFKITVCSYTYTGNTINYFLRPFYPEYVTRIENVAIVDLNNYE